MIRELNILRDFLKDIDFLVTHEMHKPTIKKASIKKISRRKKELEKLEEPFRFLFLKLLDEMLEAIRLLNEGDVKMAELHIRQKIFATIDVIYDKAAKKNRGEFLWPMI